MSKKMTKGPWTACGERRGDFCVCGTVFGDEGKVYVAQVYGPHQIDEVDPVPTREAQKANIRAVMTLPEARELLERTNKLLYALENSRLSIRDTMILRQDVSGYLTRLKGEEKNDHQTDPIQ